jgi:hypothetical protein
MNNINSKLDQAVGQYFESEHAALVAVAEAAQKFYDRPTNGNELFNALANLAAVRGELACQQTSSMLQSMPK